MPRPDRSSSVDDAFRIVTQIRRIMRAINQHSQDLSRSVGLTVAQLLLLQAVDASPDGRSTATRLRASMEVNAASMSGLVDRLVKLGFLARQRRPQDRRVVELSLTERGRALLDRAPSPLQDQVLDRLVLLSDQERAELLASLERIVALMGAAEIDASPNLTLDLELGRR